MTLCCYARMHDYAFGRISLLKRVLCRMIIFESFGVESSLWYAGILQKVQVRFVGLHENRSVGVENANKREWSASYCLCLTLKCFVDDRLRPGQADVANSLI